MIRACVGALLGGFAAECEVDGAADGSDVADDGTNGNLLDRPRFGLADRGPPDAELGCDFGLCHAGPLAGVGKEVCGIQLLEPGSNDLLQRSGNLGARRRRVLVAAALDLTEPGLRGVCEVHGPFEKVSYSFPLF